MFHYLIINVLLVPIFEEFCEKTKTNVTKEIFVTLIWNVANDEQQTDGALCTVHRAPCTVPCAPCTVPCALLTFSGAAGGSKRPAHTRKESGWGLPFFTSGSSPSTTWSKTAKNSLCWLVFNLNVTPAELVATAVGILCFCRWRTSFSTPGGTCVAELVLM